VIQKYIKSDIKKFLERISVMSIALCLKKRPISSVVLFTVDNDLSFYFITKKNTYKAKAIDENPQMSLCVWKQNDKLIQASGNIIELAGDDDFDKYYKRLQTINKELGNIYWPYLATKGSEAIVYKLLTKWLRVMDLTYKGSDSPFYNMEF